MFGFFSFIPAQNCYASHFYERVYRTFQKREGMFQKQCYHLQQPFLTSRILLDPVAR